MIVSVRQSTPPVSHIVGQSILQKGATTLKKIIAILTKIIIGCVLFAILPIVGWSIFDISGYLSSSVRLAYTITVVLLQIAVVVVEPEIGRQGNKGKTIVDRQRMAVILLQVLTLAIILIAPFSDGRDIAVFSPSEVGRYFGLSFYIIGFIIMNWAEISLGRLFSIQVTLQNDHQLVSSGLFKYIRHPRYLGIMVNNIGLSFVFRSGLALVLAFLLIIVLIWRIRDEEDLMKKEFGDSWNTYQKRSWRLLPFIY
jgi:protein-S-isoprenylcysteine O-methyltransferase Ste14